MGQRGALQVFMGEARVQTMG